MRGGTSDDRFHVGRGQRRGGAVHRGGEHRRHHLGRHQPRRPPRAAGQRPGTPARALSGGIRRPLLPQALPALVTGAGDSADRRSARLALG
ncbi:hypothetical protein MAP_3687c [Mycobacterium avium subsp. paratuberculosis K-10]|uniref:Uncharacterized protein n=1 Tax=Mycolicibacterium paratuberculosis (strain ATCC BAA-968 / K-10) TaxID=262316 RepID=Q73TN1_MYCPA|nr:hypothetical protein MAP_3687c [Mycobacterium avium subsp. paratuberculosis K-10]AGL35059.1 hypothetical protein MAP4_0084 [Mycobacterium avium subsp. paratuberculosis MAP4]